MRSKNFVNTEGPRSNRMLPMLSVALAIAAVTMFDAAAIKAALPTQNDTDPRHLDLDPVGNGILVGPGETLNQVFGDNLDSAENWYAELLIVNPTSNATAVAFAANLVWPGGSEQGTITLQPGFGYLLQVEPTDVPETRPNWLFNFKNPVNVPLIVDSSVSEALSITGDPSMGSFFVEFDGTPAPPGINNSFVPGDVMGDFVFLGIVPEPTGLGLGLIGACAMLSLRRRADAS